MWFRVICVRKCRWNQQIALFLPFFCAKYLAVSYKTAIFARYYVRMAPTRMREKIGLENMGTYINIGNAGFQRARNSEYVDTSVSDRKNNEMKQDMIQDMTQSIINDMHNVIIRKKRTMVCLLGTLLLLAGGNVSAQNQETGVRVNGSVYGGGNAANVGGSVIVNINQATAQIANDVYGGGAMASTNTSVYVVKTGLTVGTSSVKGLYTESSGIYTEITDANAKAEAGITYYEKNNTLASTYTTSVSLTNGTVTGSVYGGGLGRRASGSLTDVFADVNGNVEVVVSNGKAANVFGCNNENGAPQATVSVSIEGGEITNSVYGGGNKAAYTGSPVVEMSGGKAANVYGGGLGSTAIVTGDASVTISGGTVTSNVYGGGSEANLTGDVTVSIEGGTVTGDVYGGGAKAHTNTANWDATANSNAGDWATGGTSTDTDGNVTTTKKTTVSLTGGIVGNAYGGGLGELGNDDDSDDDDTPAYVYGDVTVTVNGTAFTKLTETAGSGTVPKTGRVFGCNNLKGTPKGSVTVIVTQTKGLDSDGAVTTDRPALNSGEYELQAVYGGGNQAPYIPANSDNQKTKVEVQGCNNSIEYVYGGGNSASVPETDVTIRGAYEIDCVFGGGNGSDKIKNGSGGWIVSPGANVTGDTNTALYGGTIHSVFGGSNTKGTIEGSTNLVVPSITDEDNCPLKITDVYGAGRNADVDNDVIIEIGCLADGIENVYGGAYNANINGKVQLTITSGVLENVFGGNNSGGTIKGPISVNIEETDNCKPIKITNLYGAGNAADYPSKDNTVDVTNPSVTVNVKACTSIDNIYGGGCDADVYGNTYVNINMVKGWWAGKKYPSTATEAIPNAIGTIGNVYGGGQNGKVYYSNSDSKTGGNATVNIGTAAKAYFVTEPVHLREDESTPMTPVASGDYVGLYEVDVEGAKIVGDVYGGGEGNATTVDGTAQVNFGAAGISYTPEVTGNIYGGSAFGTVNVAEVNLIKGDVKKSSDTDTATGNVFGGGKGQNADSNTDPVTPEYTAQVTGGTIVTLNNATVQNAIYGGCNVRGDVAGGTTVTLNSGVVGNSAATTINDVVFGGGLGLNTEVAGDVVVNVGTKSTDTTPVYAGNTKIYGSVYGGSKEGSVHSTATNSTDKTNVNLYGGLIYGNVYGGGYGVSDNASAAASNGNVIVTLDGAALNVTYETDGTTPKTGQIFGCNNVNGSPKKHVKVEVVRTRKVTDPTAATWEYSAQTSGTYEVAAVYGGGNLATYTATGENTEVIIGGSSSIGAVYGGGNQANVPASNVAINNSFEIGNVYGGGNNVANGGGTTGNSVVSMTNGKVLSGLYGGCNTNGTIGGAVTVSLTGGTIGAAAVGTEGEDGYVAEQRADVFGGGYGHSTSTLGNIGITLNGTTIYGDLYGGSALGNVNGSTEHTTTLTISSNALHGAIYGGGQGSGSGDDGKATSNGNVQIDYNVANTNLTGLYGGANINGHVEGDIEVNVTANVGASGTGNSIDIFGGGLGANTTTDGDVTVTIDKPTGDGATAPVIYGDIYGGSSHGEVGASDKTTKVDFINGTLNGTIFGGGKGQLEDNSTSPATPAVSATVSGAAEVAVSAGSITGGVYGGCNTKGSVTGDITVGLTGGTIGAENARADVFGGGYGHSTSTSGNIGITLSGTTIYGDLYGGSAMGSVNGSTDHTTTLTISSNTLHGTIYGGGQGDVEGETGHSNITATSNGNVIINYNTANTNLTGLYGGANVNGLVKGAIAVNVKANVGSSTSTLDIFGGGYGANTNTEGNVTVTIGDAQGTSTPIIYGDIYGGSALGNVNNEATDITKIDFLNGSLKKTTISSVDHGGNIYGGGLGDKANLATTQDPDHADVAAKVNGKVVVNISSNDQDDDDCKIDLRDVNIYGCNNTNGSPQADVEVHIYKTAYNYSDYTTGDIYKASYTPDEGDPASAYAINQVFGGGNLADYLPENGAENSTKKAKVYVHGCNNTIRRVFGGGNAAAATGVANEIDGGRFLYVYGGGNGEDSPANIGKGGTDLQIHGGKITTLFGGSNTSGTITGDMGISIDGTRCASNMYIAEFFCGNNLANIGDEDNHVNINATIGCGTKFGDVYGGCNQADIYGNVTLTIVGGEMNNVYGGSKGDLASLNEELNETGHTDKAANINGDVELNIYGGNIANNAYGGSNINGEITGKITVNMDWSQASSSCNSASDLHISNVYGASNLATYTPSTPGAYPEVNIKHGTVSGSVFGGGKGATATVTSNPKVTIGDANTDHNVTVSENVYGGGDLAQVIGGTSVYVLTRGTVTQDVYGGGNQATVTGSVSVTINGGTVSQDVYGGGALAETNTTAVSGVYPATTVALQSGSVRNLYGGGLGQKTGVNEATSDVAADVHGNVTVTVTGGTAANVFGANNVNGAPQGTVTVNINNTATEGVGDVYGGGNMAEYAGSPTVTMVGGKAANIYGGGLSANVGGSVIVIIQGGTVTSDVYGGGALAHTNTANWNTTDGTWASDALNTNGTTKKNTTVSLTGGTIKGNVYGGGLGNETTAAYVYGDVTVTLNGASSEGSIFGCNNLKGSPKGHVKVHVLKTGSERDGTTPIANRTAPYDLAAVYGGGNQADYRPVNNSDYAEVLIEGCEETSIQNVYGGGNAAAVPATEVTVMGAYIINSLYGGGNGAGTGNTGADVGYYDHSKTNTYGTGKAVTKLLGGYINNVYGGSNTKGDIRGGTDLKTKKDGVDYLTPSGDCCTKLVVDNLYGAGSMADVDGDVDITLDCMPDDYVAEVYGGAENANINGSVTLTVTSGKFGRVFGGNNAGGNIKGSITVNVNEGGCKPLEIGEVFGGGNAAPYSIYGCTKTKNADNTYTWTANTSGTSNLPAGKTYGVEVNVYACTSIGKVFGGGYGESAKVIGDTHVWVNMMKGYVNDVEQSTIGRIGQIYGGGSAAEVIGNTTVDIGTITVSEDAGAIITNGNYINPDATEYKSDATKHYIPIEGGVYGGGMNAAVDGNTTVNIGTAAQSLGVNIAGNIYGGGKEGDVTGNTQVNVCAVKSTTDETYEATIPSTAGVTITGNVYGGGKGIADSFTCEKAMVGTDGAGATDANYAYGRTNVIIGNGKVDGNVYGGGEVGRVEMNTSVTIGLGDGVTSGTSTSAPEITHSVFGGGKGLETHGYSALVRGNPSVIVQGNAKVRENVYGGGQIASVARYNVAKTDDEGAPYGVKKDEPYALKTNTSGFCSVTIRGNAEIGPETIGTETKTLVGHVFGAGKGILPGGDYAFVQGTTKRMVAVRDGEGHITGNTWDYFTAGEADYITFVKTLALASQTNVTIDGNAKVKGSVFGGSESGFVQFDTNVNVLGGTIGTAGKGGADFGNVYGGGKGDVEYTGANHNYITAGIVKGNTKVVISQAEGKTTKILHNVYGGGAYGTVGEFEYDATTGMPTARKTYTIGSEVHNTTGGKAEIYITGGTIGTNGNENGMIFGSSRGDVGAPGSIHDKAAWVYDTHVAIGDTLAATTTTESPLIRGSVYGGGENGHNFHSSYVRINGGTIGITSGEAIGSYTAGGASYPYRGNVYGGGCGTDMYDTNNDGKGDTYNSLAGIVRGDATIRMTNGIVVHNMYGAGAMGSVGTTDVATSGKTTIDISGGTIGVSGTVGDGNVFGAARGDEEVTAIGLAQVRETNVTISSGQVMGNVYGGGEVGDVGRFTNKTPVSVGNYDWDITNIGSGLCTVTISGGKIGPDNVALSKEHGNVFGGGKGVSNTFECEKAMVYKTNVTISNGSTVNGTVYGGGEVGRVEGNTVVTIGTENGTDEPEIKGNVFAAGAGTKTHGYSALVRGTSSVTVQGKAKVLKNVYGGGEEASVGRYKVKTPANEKDADVPDELPYGMPAHLIDGGTSTVVIKDQAVIGTDGVTTTGHVYGAGQGVDPHEVAYTYQSDATKPSRMVSGNTWEYFADEAAYLQFVETLALTGYTDVTIDEGATVKGSVFGGSESGFVYHDTDVKINNGTIKGDAFGGGRGLATFAEAGRVSGNTQIAVSGGTVEGNVYGGGNLGDVGTIKKNITNYNYIWKNSDSNGNINATGNDNAHNNNTITENNKNTGICKVTISGGTIGVDNPAEPTKHGNVFGAGQGLATTWWCEKAIAFSTDVSITKGTVKGNVYGGGQIGRVEDDAKVVIGEENATEGTTPTIMGSVFGAGAGLATHGYSALVRGNAEVTVQGVAQVGGSVYGGGEIASVGRFTVVGGLPKHPDSGGTCTVNILGHAKIGESGTGHNVFGACKGVTPAYNNTPNDPNRSKSMQLLTNAPSDASLWSHYNNDEKSPFIWRYYPDEAAYLDFLETLALTSHPIVTIAEDATVNGSVYGGGERGITLGSVEVNMNGGKVTQDVYGGGALANSNKGNWEASTNTWAEGKTSASYTTKVSLLGGTINGDAYGGGLGRKEYGIKGQTGYESPIEAMVYGDVLVELNNNNNGGDADGNKPGCAVTRVFGCNNLNGTPKGKVQVYVYATQKKGETKLSTKSEKKTNTYDVQAVYGGGNLAPYIPVDATLDYATNKAKVDAARAEVYIDGCDLTSINQVYGGGNAAPVPATYVEIRRAYEIDEVFGGGNGYDNYSLQEGNATVWYQNPGANVGYYTYATYPKGTGQGSGSQADPYIAVETSKFAGGAENKPNRLSTSDQDAVALRYGSGIATLVVKGGTVHTSYGGSNSKGNVRARLSSTYSAMYADCEMAVDQSYGGGKNAYSDAEVNQVAACAKGVKEMFGGAKDADIDNNINMLITNGSSLERVFGGNNTSGAVNGSITITIDESGCEPIQIGELYLGGFLAPYSVYGYKKTNGVYDTEDVEYIEDGQKKTRAQRIPLKKGDPGALTTPHNDPRLYVISATSIGNIFGGGYQAKLVGNPHVNVNMKQGKVEVKKDGDNYKDVNNRIYSATEYTITSPDDEGQIYAILPTGTIGNIYGGGNMADIVGDTYVEIGNGTWHNDDGVLETLGTDGKTYTYNETAKKWSYVDDDGTHTVDVAPTPARKDAHITGNVFGGGKGIADSFQCASAMIGEVDKGFGSTHVTIGNGTVDGSVYGGGEIGRVEANTNVMIGLESGTGKPTIEGDVFGAGKGLSTHGYSALVRGNTTVIIQGDAKVGHNVYGGGEIASVGKYKIADEAYHAAHPEVEVGMPYSLVSDERGICNVIVRGNAEIGPDNMKMLNTVTGKPDDTGHVFGAGKGVLPYEGYEPNVKAWRMPPSNIKEEYLSLSEAINGKDETDYLRFIETLGLATQTKVTIGGNAFVKGSVYGGSENGHVQHDTYVTIQDDCQIGNGNGVNRRYTADEWTYDGSTEAKSLAECASWDYVPTDAAPYDPYAKYSKTVGGKVTYYYDEACTKTAEGGYYIGKDGHTFYGNVFGGGSGLIPYAPGMWHRAAGSVGGNTQVDITGGHILTSVYGGNEQTDVGTYMKDSKGALVIPVSNGKCTINMTGGTVGVPRTETEMMDHPLTCYVFGAGKGDPRIFFNTWTNVINTEVNISGDARIYGSTFGGGEDGHVIQNAVTNISGDAIIGTTGTSYVDGNVFGGGRGFTGEAQTAGTVGGNVDVNISDGTMLGSVYGGGRLASVGTQFTAPDDVNYGNFIEDADGKTYGHVTVNINGGTIGRDFVRDAAGKLPAGAEHSGNVFGGSMGRLTLLNGTMNPIWPKMAQVKTTAVNVYGDAVVKRTVFGGGELGTVRDNACVTIGGHLQVNGKDSTVVKDAGSTATVGRDVYGGGYGSDDFTTMTTITVKEKAEGATTYSDVDYKFTPMIFAGCVGQNTYVNIIGGQVKKSVYGGGEMASVGIMDCRVDANGDYVNVHEHKDENNGFILSWPYHFENVPGYFGATHVKITGGRIGLNGEENKEENNPFEDLDNGDVCGGGKGIAGDYKDYVFCANVGSTEVTIDYPTSNNANPENYMTSDAIECIAGAVYGGAENGHVMGDTKLTLKNGLVGHSIYGGGSGKGQFETKLLKIGKTKETATDADYYTREIYSITAGKVFGNTEVIMEDGYVVRNVYGGGNMGSVGKGNYAGGPDDYSTAGYGEKITGDNNLWTNDNPYSQAFLSSGKSTVKILGGTVGYIDSSNPSNSMYPWNSSASLPYGNVFGGCRGESAPNIRETPRYLYSPEFFVGYVNETDVTIGAENSKTGPKIIGSVFGGGMDGHVRRDTHVEILSGEIGLPYNEDNQNVLGKDPNNIQWLTRGNVYGAGSGIGKYKYDFDYDGKYTSTVEYAGKQTKEEDYSTSAGSVTRFTTVEIKGGKIHRNVYGGGSLSSVGAPKIGQTYDLYHPEHSTEVGKQALNTVTISGGQVGDDSSFDASGNYVYGGRVFGGSRGDTELGTSFATANHTKMTVEEGAHVIGSVFGGGEAGIVKDSVVVTMNGGSVDHDLYGGGALANTNTSNWDASNNTWAKDKYAANATTYKTDVILKGGTIGRNVYGGGLGRKASGTEGQADYDPGVAAKVYGNVLVTLNGIPTEKTVDGNKVITYAPTGDCVVKGSIFGCNNFNGSPQSDVTVHIYKTQGYEGHMRTAADKLTNEDDADHTYELAAVYGGGNQAAFSPDLKATCDTVQAHVIIDGCDLTSIKNVYGGGNAASTPATNVTVNSVYEIEELFGGGNGYGEGNPGANVGYTPYPTSYDPPASSTEERAQFGYGSGVASVNIYGGRIHRVFGGSNTKGNVRQTAVTMLDNQDQCPLIIDEAYGGGKSAPMDAEAKLLMACIPGLKAVYGGAQNADIQNDVTLNITNGTFDRVFGGNNISGTIRGMITVNIEETGCKPLIIGQLYGGGNLAPYEAPAGKPGPTINVKSFTSIGDIYGGGYGNTAVVKGDTHVNINVVEGKWKDKVADQSDSDYGKSEYLYDETGYKGTTKVIAGNKVTIPSHAKGKIGAISNVFGGGNAAPVEGNTNVNIGTLDKVEMESLYEMEEVKVDGVVQYEEDGKTPKMQTKLDSNGKPIKVKATVVGADIRENVYGGGNAAKVTGKTNVEVGKKQ